MTNTSNPAPGYKQHPEHHVDLIEGPARLRVIFNNEVIADTRGAITVIETNYDPTHYIPLGDVRQDVLKSSMHRSYCPFKGEASYWSIEVGRERVEDAAWAYQEPYDEVRQLQGYVAFYGERGPQIQTE